MKIFLYRLVACALKVSYAGISTIGGTDCDTFTYGSIDQMEFTMPTDFTNQ